MKPIDDFPSVILLVLFVCLVQMNEYTTVMNVQIIKPPTDLNVRQLTVKQMCVSVIKMNECNKNLNDLHPITFIKRQTNTPIMF